MEIPLRQMFLYHCVPDFKEERTPTSNVRATLHLEVGPIHYVRASPPVGGNRHANGGWAGAKSGARSRVPATPPHQRHSGSWLPAPCKPKSGSRLPQTLISALSVQLPRKPAARELFWSFHWELFLIFGHGRMEG